MTAYSRSKIVTELANGRLVISPLLSEEQIGHSSVDLRMGNLALLARAGATSHVDPSMHLTKASTVGGTSDGGHSVQMGRMQKHERIEIQFGNYLLLHPGALALVPTLEWVVLPSNVQGVVTARSCWAREGLSIATATIVNPSYRGIVTLELANLGQIPIKLFPGLRVAQIAFYELDSPSVGAPSQFDGSFEPSAGNIAKGDAAFIPA